MKEKIIYLLDYGLSRELVFKIGWELRKQRYVLIPMAPSDLMKQLGKHKTRYPIISFIQNREHLTLDISFKRRYLFHALGNLKISCIEFTSFKDVIDRYHLTRKKNIKQFALPIGVSEIAEIVHHEYADLYEQDMSWPGGKRGAISELGEV